MRTVIGRNFGVVYPGESEVLLGTDYGTGGDGLTGTLAAPAAPTISVILDGTTAAVAITGDAEVTHHCKYKKTTETDWTDGGSRTGDGNISIENLETSATYVFIAQSELSGAYSVHSNAVFAFVLPTGSITASGDSGTAMNALADMIASSSTFQTAVGAAGDAATRKAFALTRIKIAEYPHDDEETGGFARPFALIVTPGGDAANFSSTDSFNIGGELEVWFEQEIPEAYQATGQEANAEMNFKNFVDGVVADCRELSSQPGYLITRSWTRPMGPGRIDDEQIEVYAEKINVSWGLA